VTRWSELTRKIELWVEIHELNEQGTYSPVEVTTKPEVPVGGIYQLRQVSLCQNVNGHTNETISFIELFEEDSSSI
jgi:hypothetical protein